MGMDPTLHLTEQWRRESVAHTARHLSGECWAPGAVSAAAPALQNEKM